MRVVPPLTTVMWTVVSSATGMNSLRWLFGPTSATGKSLPPTVTVNEASSSPVFPSVSTTPPWTQSSCALPVGFGAPQSVPKPPLLAEMSVLGPLSPREAPE